MMWMTFGESPVVAERVEQARMEKGVGAYKPDSWDLENSGAAAVQGSGATAESKGEAVRSADGSKDECEHYVHWECCPYVDDLLPVVDSGDPE